MFNCKKYTARNLAKHANSHGYHDYATTTAKYQAKADVKESIIPFASRIPPARDKDDRTYEIFRKSCEHRFESDRKMTTN